MKKSVLVGFMLFACQLSYGAIYDYYDLAVSSRVYVALGGGDYEAYGFRGSWGKWVKMYNNSGSSWRYYYSCGTLDSASLANAPQSIKDAMAETDTDGDGQSDYHETYYADGNAYDDTVQSGTPEGGEPMADNDGDGFPEWQEIEAGTSDTDENEIPTDTDGDGFCDASETAHGTDPLNSDSKPYDEYNPVDGWYDDPQGDIDGDTISNENDPDIDGDGISNTDEFYWGGNPADPLNSPADSDGDGFSDKMEQWYSTNPLDNFSKPPLSFYNSVVLESSNSFGFDVNENGLDDFAEWYLGGENLTDYDGDSFPDAFEIRAGTNPNNSFSRPTSGGMESGDYNSGLYADRTQPDTSGNDYDNDEPDAPTPDDPQDETPQEDDTNINLTSQDIAEAMQAALQGSQGSLSDAVAAGLSKSTDSMGYSVESGIYNSRGAIADAVSEGIENSQSDIADAVSDGVSDALGGAASGYGVGTDTIESAGEGLDGVVDSVGVGTIINDLKPDTQDAYEVTISLPTSFSVGFTDVEIADEGDMDFTVSTKPDTSTPLGLALDNYRIIFRTILSIFVIIQFGRSVTCRLFDLT